MPISSRPFVRLDVPGNGGDSHGQPELADVHGERVLGLDVPPLVVLLLLQLQLEALLFPSRFLEIIVAAGVKRQPAAMQMQDRIHRIV